VPAGSFASVPDVPAVSGHALVDIEISAPSRLAVGRGNAFVIGGWCHDAEERTRDLSVRVGGSSQRIERFGLPRDDVYEKGAASDPAAAAAAYRSGFVAVVDLPPMSDAERLDIELALTLVDGREVTAPAGSIEALPSLAAPRDITPPVFAGPDDRVAICMATYEPPGDLLQVQLESVREQTHRNWVCLVSDDHSSDEAFERILELTRDDPRFVVSRSDERLGFYSNFERALAMAPPDADYVTLCDQDDRWHPTKLERLIAGIGSARLIYSDARIVSPQGDLIRPSYWTERRNNYTNFGSLLLANSVTGAASLFRRELLDDVLPFPPLLAKGFHDHWLAVVAMALGEIAYLDEPLYDYVQHDEAVIGHLGANRRPRSVRRHLIERLRNPTGGSRAVYYYDWHQQLLFCEVLRLRCWDRMAPSKQRVVRRLLKADSGAAGLAWMLGRRARRLWGNNETLDRELFYSYALLRRRAVSLYTAGRRRPSRMLPRDAAIPPNTDRRHDVPAEAERR
jgi:glycosyltransferase involved in cell wall biosynthesis